MVASRIRVVIVVLRLIFLCARVVLSASADDASIGTCRDAAAGSGSPVPVEEASSTSATLSSSVSKQGNIIPVERAMVLERIVAGGHDCDNDSDDDELIRRGIELLKRRGAHRCWHKHSSFLDHLVGVSNILFLWGQDVQLRLIGLFHSAYSNSYVNLALLDPQTERHVLQQVIGTEAEAAVFLFCSINRQDVVVNTLLKQGYIPSEGLTVPNIRGGPNVYLSPIMLFQLVVFTMADIADQYFGWQDELFGGGGTDGSMIVPGHDSMDRHVPTALWPGISKPGLWTSYVSQLANVAASYIASTSPNTSSSMPPVFDAGMQTLSLEDDAAARDLYWSVINQDVESTRVEAVLESCIAHNPWVFEPHVLLAQTRLHDGNFDSAVEAASHALTLQHQWGTPWDKRMAFGAWVAWTKVILQRAQAQEPWPTSSWGVNNLGLVQ